MKKTAIILIFLAMNVSAINDVNISIDAQGLDMCIAVDNISYYTCNSTPLLVDGTKDHFLYFMPRPFGVVDLKQPEETAMTVLTPIFLLSGALVLFIVFAVIMLFAWMILKYKDALITKRW